MKTLGLANVDGPWLGTKHAVEGPWQIPCRDEKGCHLPKPR